MNFFLLSFLMLSIIGSFAQTDLDKQLTQIISDSIYDFQNYKGSLISTQNTDTIFYSKVNIDQTKDNQILYGDKLTIYHARIVDSIKLKKAKAVVDEWKTSLKNILGNEFNVELVKVVKWNPSQYGWTFQKGNLWVSVDVFPSKFNSTMYDVALAINRFKPQRTY